jgi:hypothetical protein
MSDKEESKLITLYHGSQKKEIKPIFGLGNDKHDFGKGFYLTENISLAREWAVCSPVEKFGWVHKYQLHTEDLKILDFENESILSWLSELMKHRDAADSKRYKMLSSKFIAKYGIQTESYDVIKGWRANASYFYIAKAFVKDEIDLDILKELLCLGELGIQYCIKTEKAFSRLFEDQNALEKVDFLDYNMLFNKRDAIARENMRALINSDQNKVVKVFSTLI